MSIVSRIISASVAAAFLPLALAAPSSTVTSSAVNPGATSRILGLNEYAQRHGLMYFGTATDNPELTDTAYRRILDDRLQFGQLTAANACKWVRSFLNFVITHFLNFLGCSQDATEPEPGVFNFTGCDAIHELALQNNQIFRCQY